MKRLLYIFLFLLVAGLSSAQGVLYTQGEVLVQLKSDASIQDLLFESSRSHSQQSLKLVEEIGSVMHIYKLKFDYSRYNERVILDQLRANPLVVLAQFDYFLEDRSTVPNDPFFDDQWQYINTGQLDGSPLNADLDIDLAWDFTTGGVTSSGDTIVVCVIDRGLLPNTEGFGDNLWINHHEIPNNNIDDDGNGYIDDVRGWHVDELTDDIEILGDRHGVSVAAIVGAKGNDGIGVTGVNWNVKVMIVNRGGNNSVTSNAIAAYSYALANRKLWNATNGASGAFVVATNASFGLDNQFPIDAPIWCSLYDSLGQAGVLSTGATTNANVNVDIVGDLPTTCPSEYLLAVTNVNQFDEKQEQAGYGPINIDLGAYGEKAFTLRGTNTYGGFGGTSSATPHVTGTIALLYSLPCGPFNDIYKQNPAAAALQVRNSILNSVVPNTTLDGITKTGGRLNVFTAAQQMLNFYCEVCPPPLQLDLANKTVSSLQLSWAYLTPTETYDFRFRKKNTSTWTTNSAIPAADEITTINGLDACTEYEIQVKPNCTSVTTAFAASYYFKTDGCCDQPIDVIVTATSPEEFRLQWPAVVVASSYEVGYRLTSAPSWTITSTNTNSININDLDFCSEYAYYVKSNCADSFSIPSAVGTISTEGCGSCNSINYCEATGSDTEFEWIQTVELGDYLNISGDNGGYGDFTSEIGPEVERSRTYELTVTPLFPGARLNDNYRVWIDFNQDEVFSTTERLMSETTNSAAGVTVNVDIPANAVIGVTRMRVALSGLGAFSGCGDVGFGEIEEYCVQISSFSSTNNPSFDEKSIQLFPIPVSNNSAINFKGSENLVYPIDMQVYSMQGELIRQKQIESTEEQIKGFNSGVYLIQFVDQEGRQLTKKLIVY